MRAVLDTNVFVSALLSATGAPAELLRGWRAGRFTLVVSEQLLTELEEVLVRPRFRERFTSEQVSGFVRTLRATADVQPDPDVAPRRSRDPKDDFLIALAASGGVDALVTGDVGLREIEGLGVPILSPRELLDLLDRMEP